MFNKVEQKHPSKTVDSTEKTGGRLWRMLKMFSRIISHYKPSKLSTFLYPWQNYSLTFLLGTHLRPSQVYLRSATASKLIHLSPQASRPTPCFWFRIQLSWCLKLLTANKTIKLDHIIWYASTQVRLCDSQTCFLLAISESPSFSKF